MVLTSWLDLHSAGVLMMASRSALVGAVALVALVAAFGTARMG